MKTIKIFFAFVILVSLPLFAQSGDKSFFVASYNVENLFDTIDDPTIDDAQFLPSDESKWDTEKYTTKLKNLAKVIDAMNDGKGPDILGLIEVENLGVIRDLFAGVKNGKNYEIVHFDSPDGRGIDVALVYNKNLFTLVKADTAVVTLPSNWPTRSILHATLKSTDGVTRHFFVNHWPSRRGGAEKSEDSRIAAAMRLKTETDKVFQEDAKANIVIMGDFNDEPTDKSIVDYLKAPSYSCPAAALVPSDQLFNIAAVKKSKGEGSYKYQGQWNMIDQMIISGNLANTGYVCDSYNIFNPEFMQQKGGKYEGSSLPTFGGKKYLGGYSDHFPIYAIFKLNN